MCVPNYTVTFGILENIRITYLQCGLRISKVFAHCKSVNRLQLTITVFEILGKNEIYRFLSWAVSRLLRHQDTFLEWNILPYKATLYHVL